MCLDSWPLFRNTVGRVAYTPSINKLYKVFHMVCSLILYVYHLFRFQVVVLSAYKQIRAQSDDILSDINEDNYDRAFSFLRPGELTTW